MFLNELSDNNAKKLFLGLSSLIMMAEGQDGIGGKVMDGNNESLNGLFQGISEEEFRMLLAYSFDLSIPKFTQEDIDDVEFDDIEVPEVLSEISEILANSAEKVLKNYKNRKEIKKEIIELLIERDMDLTDLSDDTIKEVAIMLPSLRQEILEDTAKIFIEDTIEISYLTMKDEKIIIFELIGAGFASGKFEQEEHQLLLKICEYMDVDEEYVDEFTEIMNRIFSIHKEAAELINE